MILLASDYLFFELSSGERIPLSAEMISVELMGEAEDMFESEFVKHAAASVFHHYKHDLGRDTITVKEFASALEKVLRGLGIKVRPVTDEPDEASDPPDLSELADEAGGAHELFFYARLRQQLRTQLQHSPRVVRFRGLRRCVKQLAGARRWSPRCELMHGQILEYLSKCFHAEAHPSECTLVVE